MQNKIKIFFVFLTVLAVISVMSFFDVFSGARSAKILDATSSFPPDFDNDTDNDGLSDTDESYWNTDFEKPDTDEDGFLDGEEVASRHDPTLSGPDDSLLDLNLTSKIANLTAGGLMDGSLKLDNPDYLSSMDSLALATIDDGLKTLIAAPDPKQLHLLEPSKENQELYIKTIEPVWEKFFIGLNTLIQDLEDKFKLTNDGGLANAEFISYFVGQRILFDNIAKEWTVIDVPSNWQDEHLGFLAVIQEMSNICGALARGKDDPIKATMAFNLFIAVPDKVPTIVKLYSDKASSLDISNDLFR